VVRRDGVSTCVTRDVPAYAIVAGVPAEVVKQRFPPVLASRIQELAWWDWDHERLHAAIADFRLLTAERSSRSSVDRLPPRVVGTTQNGDFVHQNLPFARSAQRAASSMRIPASGYLFSPRWVEQCLPGKGRGSTKSILARHCGPVTLAEPSREPMPDIFNAFRFNRLSDLLEPSATVLAHAFPLKKS
jgi:hypothetical protein